MAAGDSGAAEGRFLGTRMDVGAAGTRRQLHCLGRRIGRVPFGVRPLSKAGPSAPLRSLGWVRWCLP